jgi:hypothetical protein
MLCFKLFVYQLVLILIWKILGFHSGDYEERRLLECQQGGDTYSEMPINARSTQRHIPEHDILNINLLGCNCFVAK